MEPVSEAAPPAAPPPPPHEVLPALAALDRGDFFGARAEAKRLLAGDPSKDVKRAAKQVLRRLGTDSWAVRATIAAALAIAFVALTYLR